jgi:hypothetical protein
VAGRATRFSRPEGELGFIFQGLGSFFDLAPKLASEATEGGR